MNKRAFNTVLVTGGAGFIGSNFIRVLFASDEFVGTVVNVDSLTYAGNLGNLSDVENEYGGKRYHFRQVDIRDDKALSGVFSDFDVNAVLHFAAESHVDRSILGPGDFVTTNIIGTFNLLEAARAAWQGKDGVLFHHVSTDEVFGSLGPTGAFTETTPYDPRSPYSASKASSDHLVRSYFHTYNLPITISNCSNNYGPYQFPEKLLPVMILNMIEGKPLPVYGDGSNIRDWLYVTDHSDALLRILDSGKPGETYNIGGENEWTNIDLVNRLCEIVAEESGEDASRNKALITFVTDRPGHDQRYAIDCSKIKRELGWAQKHSFDDGLRKTVKWYLGNSEWIDSVKSGEYRKWIEANYAKQGRT
ncbi:MAG: dTDP-glucose 4,6-dehydratase [Spirochaetales bacterium]|nr:dTDP-glucose 4,6-dehydratase [Spirochaetales bacterium]